MSREAYVAEPGSSFTVRSDAGDLTLMGSEGNELVVISCDGQRYHMGGDEREWEVFTVGPGPGLTINVPTTVERITATVRGGALVVQELDENSFRSEPRGEEPVRWRWHRAEV